MADSLSGNRPDRNAPDTTRADPGGGRPRLGTDAAPAEVAGLVLAAGEGRRLRPLTDLRPKALCPIGGVPLVDLALERVGAAVDEVAVNVHHGRDQLLAHLEATWPGVHASIEEPVALGTAGALSQLRPWLAGRAVLVHNADAWTQADLAAFVAGWDGSRVRVLLAGAAQLGPRVGLGATLVPWSEVATLPAVPAGLYETTLAPAAEEGRLDVVVHAGPFVDCGTPARYLAANLAAVERARVAGGGSSIIDPRARIDGQVQASVVGAAHVVGHVDRCVLWDGAVVEADERLSQVVRAPGLRRDVDCR